MQDLKILVTGFGPFPGQADNPTEALALGLRGGQVAARVLPTEFVGALREFRAALAQERPDIVICFGVAARRDKISLEQTARNRTGGARADAAGMLPQAGVIRADGPDSYRATLPLTAIYNALAADGVLAESSDDAGDYVCNYIFYQLMDAIAEEEARTGRVVTGGFIHVPDPAVSGIAPARLADAARAIVAACVPPPAPGLAPF